MTLDNDKTVYQRNFALLFNKNLSSNDAENLEELFTENKEDYHIILYDFENFILYNKKTTKTWGNAFSNIQKLRMISYKKLKKSNNFYYDIFDKMLEYLDFAVNQKLYIDHNIKSLEEEITRSKNYLNDLNNKIRDSNKKVIKLKNNINNFRHNVYTDFIAILGIFTAITFATFGGLQLLSNIFRNISKLSSNSVLGKILILSSLFGVMIFGIIEILFRLINEIKNSKTHNTNNWILFFLGLIFVIGIIFIFI